MNTQADSLNSKYEGEKLIFPRFHKALDSLYQNRKGPAIVVYYDVSCSSCLAQMSLWKSLIAEFEAKAKDVKFLFFLSAENELELDFHLQEIKFPKQYVIVAVSDELQKRYPFLKEGAFNTALIDSDRKIVFIGSPLISQRIKEIYLETLRDL